MLRNVQCSAHCSPAHDICKPSPKESSKKHSNENHLRLSVRVMVSVSEGVDYLTVVIKASSSLLNFHWHCTTGERIESTINSIASDI